MTSRGGSPAPVAVVTGASRGIGEATARELAGRGWSVVLACEPSAPWSAGTDAVAADIVRAGGAAEVISADLADPSGAERLVTQTVERFGRLDAIVANAAVDQIKPWTELTVEDWGRTMDVNVRASWLLARAGLTPLAASPNPSIVLLSSIMVRTGAPGRLHYTTSKAAIVGMARALAREVGAAGIRVNVVMPGSIRTESETERFGTGIDDEVIAGQALKRRGLARDVAAAIAFLIGEDATFITGQVLAVDGGATF